MPAECLDPFRDRRGRLLELQDLRSAQFVDDDGAAHGFFRGADFGRDCERVDAFLARGLGAAAFAGAASGPGAATSGSGLCAVTCSRTTLPAVA